MSTSSTALTITPTTTAPNIPFTGSSVSECAERLSRHILALESLPVPESKLPPGSITTLTSSASIASCLHTLRPDAQIQQEPLAEDLKLKGHQKWSSSLFKSTLSQLLTCPYTGNPLWTNQMDQLLEWSGKNWDFFHRCVEENQQPITSKQLIDFLNYRLSHARPDEKPNHVCMDVKNLVTIITKASDADNSSASTVKTIIEDYLINRANNSIKLTKLNAAVDIKTLELKLISAFNIVVNIDDWYIPPLAPSLLKAFPIQHSQMLQNEDFSQVLEDVILRRVQHLLSDNLEKPVNVLWDSAQNRLFQTKLSTRLGNWFNQNNQ